MDPGTALAVVSLSFELFARCVRGFVLVSDARNIGKDAAIERTKLVLQEYRLIEWARAINLDTPHQDDDASSLLMGPSHHPAALVLLQLEQILSSTESLKKRYSLELVSPPDGADDLVLSDKTITAEDSTSSILSRIVSTDTRKRILECASKVNRANPVPKRLWWAAVDKKKYAQLVSDVTGLVDGLWSLLDMSHQAQTSRAVNKTLRLAIQASEDIRGLLDLQTSLYDSTASSDMSNGLAASAGLKAQRILLASRNPNNGGSSDETTHGRTSARARSVLDPSQLTGVHMMTSTIGSAFHQGDNDNDMVLIEEKRVQPNMKAKLRPRVEALVHLLSEPPTPSFQTFPCLGYTEEQGGFRLVFRFPRSASPPRSLYSVLSRSSERLPDVGTRLCLAAQVCQTLLSFHTAGWLHKDVRSENILLVSSPSPSCQKQADATDSLGQPYLCGFSFARQDSPTEISEQPAADISRDIYRHSKALGEPSEAFERYMDAYSLGCVLAEIAEWTPLRKIVKKHLDASAAAGAGGAGDVRLSDVASLQQWMHDRYVTEGIAGFRLGAAFMKMMALCIPRPNETPDLAEFHAALEDMVACRI